MPTTPPPPCRSPRHRDDHPVTILTNTAKTIGKSSDDIIGIHRDGQHRKIVKHRTAIDAALEHGLSQGLIESTNTKIRLLTRIAFGFRSPEALIALAMLALGGHRPALPGRKPTHG